ncbi:hypothetical protein N7474_009970 [Penicillium riverlandense]|uniref:uncharacterized protein n=1 Tax=Penicillium riverlandense TaxID=1903569 RepID=UPI002546809A|nr:uncharacterized protein N7474_009970 [Penicillium riverlandense]KAJ5808701.1 hypothetical protein N7474_009970 [Penicillium riverlandense]
MSDIKNIIKNAMMACPVEEAANFTARLKTLRQSCISSLLELRHFPDVIWQPSDGPGENPANEVDRIQLKLVIEVTWRDNKPDFPPANTRLSDELVYLAVKYIPAKARGSYWPYDFTVQGDIRTNRVPSGPPVIVWAHGLPFFPVYRGYYILTGREHARYIGWKLRVKDWGMCKHAAIWSIGAVLAPASAVALPRSLDRQLRLHTPSMKELPSPWEKDLHPDYMASRHHLCAVLPRGAGHAFIFPLCKFQGYHVTCGPHPHDGFGTAQMKKDYFQEWVEGFDFQTMVDKPYVNETVPWPLGYEMEPEQEEDPHGPITVLGGTLADNNIKNQGKEDGNRFSQEGCSQENAVNALIKMELSDMIWPATESEPEQAKNEDNEDGDNHAQEKDAINALSEKQIHEMDWAATEPKPEPDQEQRMPNIIDDYIADDIANDIASALQSHVSITKRRDSMPSSVASASPLPSSLLSPPFHPSLPSSLSNSTSFAPTFSVDYPVATPVNLLAQPVAVQSADNDQESFSFTDYLNFTPENATPEPTPEAPAQDTVDMGNQISIESTDGAGDSRSTVIDTEGLIRLQLANPAAQSVLLAATQLAHAGTTPQATIHLQIGHSGARRLVAAARAAIAASNIRIITHAPPGATTLANAQATAQVPAPGQVPYLPLHVQASNLVYMNKRTMTSNFGAMFMHHYPGTHQLFRNMMLIYHGGRAKHRARDAGDTNEQSSAHALSLLNLDIKNTHVRILHDLVLFRPKGVAHAIMDFYDKTGFLQTAYPQLYLELPPNIILRPGFSLDDLPMEDLFLSVVASNRSVYARVILPAQPGLT